MSKRLLLFSTLMLLIVSLSAIYVEVGSGTSTSDYIPAFGYYSYGWSRTIYLQSDLTYEMGIHTISYNVQNSPNDLNLNNQSYYMRHTTDLSIMSTDYIDPATDDSFQLVFTGSVTYNGTGWNQLILDTIFEYNGTDNLEIAVINNMGSWNSFYPVFNGTVAVPERAVYDYQDGSFPTTPGMYSAVYPNTRFYFSAEGEPGMASLTAPLNGTFNMQPPVELTWVTGTDTDWVKVYFSDDVQQVNSMNQSALLINNYTQESYIVDDLNTLTNYYWRIVSGNNATEYLVPSAVWSFTTAAAEGSIVIGNGTELDTHLPMEPYWGYTISQTIYNQEWINVDEQRIEQVSYYFNGNSSWVEDVQIFMAHTTLDSFADGNSWVLDSELLLVFDGQLVVPAAEGWVTLQLSVPFNYNNTDNLLIAFAANTEGCVGFADDFHATFVTGQKSISYYSDSTHSNFITPEEGTTINAIPNTLLTMGEIPNAPQLMVHPTSHQWNDTIINTSGIPKIFTMRNTGLGELIINSVTIDQNIDFILTDNNTYPISITDNIVQFTVNFHPLTVGDFSANITINDSVIGNTVIPLTASGYDAMIYDFPHFEGFEDLSFGELPQDWVSVISSPVPSVTVGAYPYMGYEGNVSLEFYNSYDSSPTLIALTPPVSNLAMRRIRFMGHSSTLGASLIVGTAVNNSGDIQFVARDTISFTTTYQQYQHGFSGADEDAQFIALKFNGNGNEYISLYLDNFYIETIPSGAAIVVNEQSIDFGTVYLNRTGQASLHIENWGIDDLEIDLSSTGAELSFSPEELTISPSGSSNVIVQLVPQAVGAYNGSFTLNSNDLNLPVITITTTANILPALPDNITVIGSGTLVNQGLPLEPWYRSSYSQSIYYAGEIGITDQRIENISWYYNGYSTWGPDELKIYMGLTTKTQFDNNTDWISVDEMMEV